MTDLEYETYEAEIVRLQNENYNSPEAAELQEWLGEQVLADYLESITVESG